MPRRIESLFIRGPAGRIEALLEEPEHGSPVEAALVLHPHPLHGGTMHNKVVHRLARGLRKSGCVVLRFNFRGVNLSEGAHDDGRGETDDAAHALAVMRERYPSLPYTIGGFSFGSRVAAQLVDRLGPEGPGRIILVGYPTIYGANAELERLRRLRVFVQSTHDEFGPRAQFQALYDRLWGPKRIFWVEARDHFFSDALGHFEHVITQLGTLKA